MLNVSKRNVDLSDRPNVLADRNRSRAGRFPATYRAKSMRYPWTQYDGNTLNTGKRYRVRWLLRNAGRGMSGWSDHTRMVETEEEGRAAVAASMGIAYEVQLDRRDGNAWTRICNRKR